MWTKSSLVVSSAPTYRRTFEETDKYEHFSVLPQTRDGVSTTLQQQCVRSTSVFEQIIFIQLFGLWPREDDPGLFRPGGEASSAAPAR